MKEELSAEAEEMLHPAFAQHSVLSTQHWF